MNKFLLSLTASVLYTGFIFAQDFKYGAYKLDEMNMTSYKNDTSAHAVVLNEFGNAYFSTQDGVPLIFEHHVKIKIFDSKGFKEGTIEIPLYIGDNDRFEKVEEISGVTYYKDDQGNIQKTEFDPKNVFTTKYNKYRNIAKFTMPNLRSGCIIEYKYRVISPFRHTFHTWEFQSDIPKVFSYYKAQIPAVFTYNIILRGALKLLDDAEYKPEAERECFSYYGTKCDCSLFKFAMKDIPAFIEEEHMTSPKNFLSAIYFEMAEQYNMNTGGTQKLTKEWKDVDYELSHDTDFGGQLKKKDYFKEKLAPLLAGKTDTLERAKIAYNYIQKNIRWNEIYSFTTDDGIRKAFEKRSGLVGDVNLGLVAALSAAGINAYPVLISTRDHGIVNKLTPVIAEFNYVIVKTDIGGKTYMLDATDPLLSFGMLPMRCLNDQGRVMSLDKPSYWMVLTNKPQLLHQHLILP